MNKTFVTKRKLRQIGIFLPHQRPITYCVNCGECYDRSHEYCTKCRIRSYYLVKKQHAFDFDRALFDFMP
ncbi:MAG: hypothetical protein ACXAD7_14860 [Candidatus Kariarchaeaceae archaeon]